MASHKLSIAFLFCLALAIDAKSVTYEGIGTFHDTDFFDLFHRPIVMLPESPEKIDPTFTLYTKETRMDPETLYWKDQESISKSHFNGANPTKFEIHGFIDNTHIGDWEVKLKDQFLANGEYNVVVIDWSKGNGPIYDQAIANTRVVGPMIAIMIQDMIKVSNASMDNFHILGHSLGAHVAGAAGKFLNGTLGHITGFDPAGPAYEGLPAAARLWHTDAKFVEAIHTDAKALIPYVGLGMYETCAHVDIYPNGGVDQPGCDKERFTTIIFKGLFDGLRRIVACNHYRSVDFYTAALEHNEAVPRGYLCEDYQQFKEGRCQDCGENGEKCVVMGLHTEEFKNTTKNLQQVGRRFFFGTGPAEPYFKYEYAVNVKIASDNHLEVIGKINLGLSSTRGHSETFDFNENEMVFHHGQVYSKVVALDNDLGELSSVDFSFTHGLNIFHHKIYVDNIEIVALSNHNITRSANTNKFCNTKHINDGIETTKHFTFTERC